MSKKRALAVLLAAAGFAVAPGLADAVKTAPTLTASGSTLQWTAVAGTSVYELKAAIKGQAKHPDYEVSGTTFTPPTLPGHSVLYRVRALAPKRGTWSKGVRINYEGSGEPPEEEPVEEGKPAACSLFASTSGSDSNPGSSTSPLRTPGRLESRLKPGQTGCLQSGQTFVGEASFSTSGTAGSPITITSTVPSQPATIRGVVTDTANGDYITLSHVIIRWNNPAPYPCWNAAGNGESERVITGPGKCATGKKNPAGNAVVTYIEGSHDTFAYDDVSSENTPAICFVNVRGSHATIDHSVIHECGKRIEAQPPGFPTPNEEAGWHMHGVYDYGVDTQITNNIIYGNSKNGVLFYPSGQGGLAEHNVIDANGSGVWFGENKNDLVQYNIITNSYNPRSGAFGIGSNQSGTGNVAKKNCLYGNAAGNVEKGGHFTSSEELEANPLYRSQSTHDYRLSASSPCLGYGPDTIQP